MLILTINGDKENMDRYVRNGRNVKIQSSLISSAPSDAPSSQEAKCWSVESQRQETPALSAASEDANDDTISLLMKLDLGEVLQDFDYGELQDFDFGDMKHRPPIVNHNQNTFDDFPDETKDVPLFDPAPRYQEEFQEPIEQVEVHLFVYDVDRRDEPDEIPAHGPVSLQRVSASYNDLAPYFGDIIGFKEIGFVRKTDIAEAKRNLSAEYMKSLILPFNCCLDYKQWTKIQVMESVFVLREENFQV
ncbi:hypothetical protein B9Z55_021507 [Caenorhabditis nigoni]|uniref:Uncharacterized protein n=1 Tax=Caenorhabditis nigoni TaxID=1611254 RepID=A0A2G5TS80_9PELO|nr:hypothetical protein B9Z55_021507 [Caenorhabditis nigoni]